MVRATQPFTGAAHPPWWTVTDTYPVGKELLTPGRQLTIEGSRQVFTFVNHTTAPPRPGSGKRLVKEWVTLLGSSGYRSVRPEQIRRVLPPAKPARRNRGKP
jgi:hypothetical protein